MTNTGTNTGLRALARTIGRLALTLGLALFVVSALLATRAQAGGPCGTSLVPPVSACATSTPL